MAVSLFPRQTAKSHKQVSSARQSSGHLVPSTWCAVVAAQWFWVRVFETRVACASVGGASFPKRREALLANLVSGAQTYVRMHSHIVAAISGTLFQLPLAEGQCYRW